MKRPTRQQWAQLFKVLSKKEKIAFSFFFLLFLCSFAFICLNFYFQNTITAPDKGGTHIEGIIGQPRFINPVYANSDPDRDLSQLIFSGLMKYDQNLNIVADLAETFEIEEEGRVYKFYLKQNLLWHDNTPLTADDVVFTIKTIQNPDFKSPVQANWVGVEVEKINELGIKFTLRKPYSAFLENCALGIIPKHIWENVSAENFAFEPYNLEPIGSGPYKIKKIKENRSNQITSIILDKNPLYYGKEPNISKIKFLFFDNEQELIKAWQKGEINGLSLNSSIELGKNWKNHTISMPRYFAVFFNQDKSKVLVEKDVRLALNYAVNKREINENIENIVVSPILPKIYGFELPSEIYEFDIEKAKLILEEAGFKQTESGYREKIITKKPAFQFKTYLAKGSKGKEVTELQKCLDGEATGYFGSQTEQLVIQFQEKHIGQTTGTLGPKTRAKLNEICFEEPDEIMQLKFALITVDQPKMIETAKLLKEQWLKVGAEVEIQQYSIFQLEQDFIKPRNYDALLFGEVLGAVPDPFPFWHSSQKNNPGLNLALYENKKADELLEQNRKSPDPEERAEKLQEFQNILIQDMPCIFLYSPDYIYSLKDIKGFDIKKITDPSKRFIGIENWYIKTKRVWN